MTVVDDARGLIERRLRELDREQRMLRNVLRELSQGEPRSKRLGRPRGSGSRAARQVSRPRRPQKGGTRADYAVAFIEKNPGSTAKQVADALKIQPSYLYRVLADLSKEGRLKKDGRAYSVAN